MAAMSVAAPPVSAPAPDPAPAVPAPGFEEGYAEGLRQGLAEAQARIEREIESRWQAQKSQLDHAERRRTDEHAHRIATLEAMLQPMQKAMPERFLALERQAIELAYEALCRVCGPHAEQERGVGRAGLLADLMRQAVQQLRGQAWLGVRLHPKDHAVLLGSEAGRSLVERYPQVRFAADAALEPLAIVIESDHGQLDASLQTQLSRLRDLWAQAAGTPVEQEEP
ncbi:MAG TPA: FliH/SctL family protein [Ideonella sp.]|uniref:FliH/SctL family protein n=1 Tax=Ideonella sp. TaxID=1929293 RepID=UPI002E3463E1|nr:FliH/SctL family protein [Ideonella sp.]HEX5682652.1 FliH/SctL family protein [Ideonella sp.]